MTQALARGNSTSVISKIETRVLLRRSKVMHRLEGKQDFL